MTDPAPASAPAGSRDARPTLRRTWAGMAAVFLVTLVVLGGLLVGMTQYQRHLSNQTTAHLESRMAAVVGLQLALLEVDAPAAGAMYELGGPAAYAGHLADYEVVRGRVAAALDDVGAVVDAPGEHELLQDARESWASVDAAVLSAPEQVASGAVADALASGDDPFRDAWEQLSTMNASLSQLQDRFVVDLREHMSDNAGTERLLLGVAVGTLVLAALATLWSLRTLRRRVVAPIAELRAAALAMGDASWDGTVDVHGGVAELGDLARTLTSTASSLRHSHRQLQVQANTDGLTGLANRIAFTEALRGVLTGPDQASVGVLFIDLDDFKVVNDSLGHAAGDAVLRVVADRLRSITRADAVVARLGGDEFAVAMVDASQAEVAVVGERLLEVLQTPLALQGHHVDMGCSIGVAMADGSVTGDPVEDVVHRADQAMYIAKQQGKNRLELFTPQVYAELAAGAELRRDLAQAAERDELELDYQPILDLSSGQVRGFEALVRWRHPVRGRLAPDQFIRLAEDTGDILAIGAWVLDRACRDLADLHASGQVPATTWVSVNVSGRQLDTPDLVPVVTDALQRHAVDPAALVLEITEATAATCTDVATASLDHLRALGVVVALDDFGSGFSSLRYLAELPVDVIKIDRSFVSDHGPRMHAALRAIATLGRRLGLDLIAEGIEDLEDLQHLRGLGTMAGQGYYFARPMPSTDVAAFLTSVRAGAAASTRAPEPCSR